MYQKKVYDLKALDVDTTNRKVKVAFSRIGNIDRDGDIIMAGAFNRTFAAKGPKGTNEIWHMTDHGWALDKALSKYEEVGIDGDMAYGVAPYRDSFMWREVAWPLYEAGDINQHSFGFRIVKWSRPDEKGPRYIEEVEMYEGSAVLWGANPETPTMDVLKSIYKEKKETLQDQIEWICKALKDGKYSGERESLLMLDLMQLTEFKAQASSATGVEPSPTEAIKEAEAAAILTKLLTVNF